MRLAVTAIVAAGVASVLLWPKSDKALSAALVGHWRAVDPGNPTLHKHEEGVEKEEITIKADGRLSYSIVLKPGSSSKPVSSQHISPAGDLWGWKVVKGRLAIRDLGPGSTQEWLPSLKFSVSRNRLSISRRQFAAKEFIRVE